MRFLWERWKFWFHIWTANLNVQALIISNLNVQNDSLVMHTSEQQLDERTEHKTSDRKLIKHLILVPRRPVTFYPCSRCHSIQVITVPKRNRISSPVHWRCMRSFLMDLRKAQLRLPNNINLIAFTVFLVRVLIPMPSPQRMSRIDNLYIITTLHYIWVTNMHGMAIEPWLIYVRTSRIPCPKLLSLNALHSGCSSQQNFPFAGPDEKFKWHTPPYSGRLSACDGHIPGSSAWTMSIFSMFPPSPTVMYTGAQWSSV